MSQWLPYKLFIGTLLLTTIIAGCSGSNIPVSTAIAQESTPIPAATSSPPLMPTVAASPTPGPLTLSPTQTESPPPTLPAPATPTASPSPTKSISPTPPLATTAPISSTVTPVAPAVEANVLTGPALVEALRQGGYVIYFRHAATDYSIPESQQGEAWWKSCDPQVVRNLSEAGRRQARAIGEAFLALQIPVDRVLSSEFCRVAEAARLAFGEIELSPDLTGFGTADEAERERRIAALQAMLATSPPAGANTILVGHLFNIQAAANVSLPEGGAAIFEPLGRADFRLIARVSADEWSALAQP
jgi:phosphohistidine phosphatase SixA